MDMKERWKVCEEVAKVLGLTKGTVYTGYSVLEPFIPKILENDQETIAQVTALQWYGHGLTQQPPKKKKGQREEVIEDSRAQLRTGMWFIQKMGSVDRARKVLDAAAAAMSILED